MTMKNLIESFSPIGIKYKRIILNKNKDHKTQHYHHNFDIDKYRNEKLLELYNPAKETKTQTFVDCIHKRKITEDEYKEAGEQSKLLLETFKHEFVFEIFHLARLTSKQRHLMEFVVYIIGFQFFEWNYIKNQLMFVMKDRLSVINYDNLNEGKVNKLLNQLLFEGEFPIFIPPYSIDYLYKWAKCQMIIIFYLFQHKNKERTHLKSDINDKGHSSLQSNNTTLISGEIVPKTGHIKMTHNHHEKQNTTRLSRRNYLRQFNSIGALPSIIKPMKKKENNKFIHEHSLVLNGFDYFEDKLMRECNELQSLPLLHNRSIIQLRDIYNCNKLYRTHKEDNKRNSVGNYSLRISDKDKLIAKIANNGGFVLDSLPEERFNEIISNEEQ